MIDVFAFGTIQIGGSMETKDFNQVIKAQLTASLMSGAVSNELKLIDNGYMITITVEKLDEDVE